MASKTQRRLCFFSFHRTPLLMSRRNPGLPQRISSNGKIFLGQTQCLQKGKTQTTLSLKDSSFRCAAAWPCAVCTACDAEPWFGSGSWCADGWKWLATGSGDSNSSCYKNYHFCALSVTNSTLDFPLLFNPLNSRARSHKNSFQYLHHRNSPKP